MTSKANVPSGLRRARVSDRVSSDGRFANTASAVAAAVRHGAGTLLEDLRLFDVYEGPQVGAGRKSLAFALRLRAPDRTLTADETGAIREAAVRAAAESCGATLRGG